MIPRTFYEWHHCITEKCGIQLTQEYIKKRLNILTDNTNHETIIFKEFYGVDHLYMVISWNKEASKLIN